MSTDTKWKVNSVWIFSEAIHSIELCANAHAGNLSHVGNLEKVKKEMRRSLTRMIEIDLLEFSPGEIAEYGAEVKTLDSFFANDSYQEALDHYGVLEKLYKLIGDIKDIKKSAGTSTTHTGAMNKISNVYDEIAQIISDNRSWIINYAIDINHEDKRVVAVYEEERWPEEVMSQM